MGLAEKVQSIGIEYIKEYYDTFLDDFTQSTAKNYRTDLNLFFKMVYDKEPQFVTLDDIRGTSSLAVRKYYKWLKDNYKNASVNRKINAIKSFFRSLNNDFEDIDDTVFKGVKRLDTDEDSSSWGGLDWKEAIEMWEYAQEHFGGESNQMSMLIKLASITSVRLNALLGSTWEEHWFTKNENGIDIHYIEVYEKKKLHKKPISNSFYEELRTKLGTTGQLFPTLYDKKIGRYLKQIVEALGFDPRRNIKFHSFKKAGVMRALEVTGDMYKAKEQGNHSSMNTSEKYYLKYKENLMGMTSYSMDMDVDVNKDFGDFTKEELLKAISQMTDGSKFELLRILKG